MSTWNSREIVFSRREQEERYVQILVPDSRSVPSIQRALPPLPHLSHEKPQCPTPLSRSFCAPSSRDSGYPERDESPAHQKVLRRFADIRRRFCARVYNKIRRKLLKRNEGRKGGKKKELMARNVLTWRKRKSNSRYFRRWSILLFFTVYYLQIGLFSLRALFTFGRLIFVFNSDFFLNIRSRHADIID